VELNVGGIAVDGVIGFRKSRLFPYELSQEYGAKARAGGAMAIPISHEAKGLSQRGISARDFPRKLFRPEGTHVLAEKGGARWANQFGRGDGSLTIHYVLVKSIPPRLHFRENVTDNLDIVADEVIAAWRRR
jgi:hypothetical protein